jgi:hypothetical protein
MKRLAANALISIACTAIVIAMTPVAEAQRGEGRGRRDGRGFGRGGGLEVSLVGLANADEVQTALNLSDEQEGKIDEINDSLRRDRRDLFQQGDGEIREQMEKLNQEATAKLLEVLDEAQSKRLLGILAQVDVGAALNNAQIAKELSITDDQKKQLAEVRESNRDAMRDAWQKMQDQNLSREERRTKANELRTAAEEKLLAELTSDQQAQFAALKGEPVQIDRSRLFGRGEGRGRREGRGDRAREGAERTVESDSDRGA